MKHSDPKASICPVMDATRKRSYKVVDENGALIKGGFKSKAKAAQYLSRTGYRKVI